VAIALRTGIANRQNRLGEGPEDSLNQFAFAGHGHHGIDVVIPDARQGLAAAARHMEQDARPVTHA
jgi:hypothetical protein